MQRSESQQLLIGQGSPDSPSMLIPVGATPLIGNTNCAPSTMHPGMMMPGQTIEQVR
jgi:hypothetical protein